MYIIKKQNNDNTIRPLIPNSWLLQDSRYNCAATSWVHLPVRRSPLLSSNHERSTETVIQQCKSSAHVLLLTMNTHAPMHKRKSHTWHIYAYYRYHSRQQNEKGIGNTFLWLRHCNRDYYCQLKCRSQPVLGGCKHF